MRGFFPSPIVTSRRRPAIPPSKSVWTFCAVRQVKDLIQVGEFIRLPVSMSVPTVQLWLRPQRQSTYRPAYKAGHPSTTCLRRPCGRAPLGYLATSGGRSELAGLSPLTDDCVVVGRGVDVEQATRIVNRHVDEPITPRMDDGSSA